MINSSRDFHSDRDSTHLVGPGLQATALGTGRCSIPERARKQQPLLAEDPHHKAHDAQRESGTGLQ